MNDADSNLSTSTDATVILELPLQTSAVKLWMNTSSAVFGGLFLAATVVLCMTAGLLGLLALLPGALIIGVIRFYWRRYEAHFSCRLLEDGLLVRRGVWWRAEIFVPRSRIQHTEVNQGPLARRFEIAQIAVYTAGSHASKVEVDGLKLNTAITLRDQLLGRDGHDAV